MIREKRILVVYFNWGFIDFPLPSCEYSDEEANKRIKKIGGNPYVPNPSQFLQKNNKITGNVTVSSQARMDLTWESVQMPYGEVPL